MASRGRDEQRREPVFVNFICVFPSTAITAVTVAVTVEAEQLPKCANVADGGG